MRVPVTILLLTFSLTAAAQPRQGQARLDSLLAELPRAAEDTMAVRLLDNISFAYCTVNPDAGLRYAGKALSLARKIGWRQGEAMAYNDFGNNYLNKAAYPQALDYFFKALRIDEETGSQQTIGKVSLNIGTVYFRQRNYDKALEYSFRSLTAARAAADKELETIVLGNIGNIYYEQQAYGESLVYMQQALHLSEALNDNRGIISQLGNIGNVYAALGKREEGLVYLFRALHLAEAAGDRQMIAASEGNIGETYRDIVADTTARLTAAGRAENLAKAVIYLRRGIQSAREVAFNEAVIGFMLVLSDIYKLQGNYLAALETYQQYNALNDSTFNFENSEKIAGLETGRALELKDKDLLIARLEVARKRNERWAFTAGIALLLLLIGILLRSFGRQRRSNALLSHEKKRSDDLLLNILPAGVAEELKETGTAQARQYDEVTVLFTDFVNFTGTAEQMTPQALVQELHECFTAFDGIMERNGLEKIKTIGDAYMAVCGMPLGDPLHAGNAVQAALDIRDFINERRRQTSSFEVRIGVHSGAVVAGIVGVKKFAYDIWGDTVNTAARMEQHGMPGAVNISQTTYELVKQQFRCEFRGKLAAKNKGEVEMYFAEPLQQDASS